ncbi:unnamed protein product, partial [Rotaria magnacalcarata]
SVQLKVEAENFEHQEQAIVDHFANALGRLILFYESKKETMQDLHI